jgi:hypothetical protein
MREIGNVAKVKHTRKNAIMQFQMLSRLVEVAQLLTTKYPQLTTW